MKNFIKIIFGVAIVCAIYLRHSLCSEPELKSLILQNVEALAGTESGTSNCWGIGSVDCPRGNDKVYYVSTGYSLGW